LPNAALLGGFAALTGQITLDAIARPSASASLAAPGERNVAAANGAYAWSSRQKRSSPCCDRLRDRVPSPKRSRAVSPRGRLRLPDLTPDPHHRGDRRDGEGRQLSPCEFINVESEFAAMSVSIGARRGARAYTATASQGLLFMIEAVYNAAGLGLPIVMTLANRAIGAPINIWNDHSDAMAARDSGWIQLFAETNQEAADLHVQAFRLAENSRSR
jgi:hypothetical protein